MQRYTFFRKLTVTNVHIFDLNVNTAGFWLRFPHDNADEWLLLHSKSEKEYNDENDKKHITRPVRMVDDDRNLGTDDDLGRVYPHGH